MKTHNLTTLNIINLLVFLFIICRCYTYTSNTGVTGRLLYVTTTQTNTDVISPGHLSFQCASVACIEQQGRTLEQICIPHDGIHS